MGGAGGAGVWVRDYGLMKKPENTSASTLIPLVPADAENEEVVRDQLRFIVSLHHPLQTAIEREFIKRLENLSEWDVTMQHTFG